LAMAAVEIFQETRPNNETYWRSIVLFGRNVASYKFALAKSLLDLAEQDKTHLTAEELAAPFSKYICEHLQQADKQGTSGSSSFLTACRQYNQGQIEHDQLISTTARLGFNNVLDAFHIVNGIAVPDPFFVKQGASNSSGIILTDQVYRLKEIAFETNLDLEVEARWRLVETAWDLQVPTHTLKVEHDQSTGLLTIDESGIERKSITPVRPALNGYQKGKCFYCFADIDASGGGESICDVDHFFPFTLQPYTPVNLDGIWNLVLACPFCNRGGNGQGKMAKIPAIHYLERLNRRNNFLVNSHHPLRETIMAQTGLTDESRRQFLQGMDRFAIEHLAIRWEISLVGEPTF